MRWRGAALASLIAAAMGCSTSGFECLEDAQCSSGEGVCAAPGYCAFPDDACASGLAYGEHANGGVAGQCVPEPDGGTMGASSSSTGDMSTSEGGPDATTTTLGLDDATSTGSRADDDGSTSASTGLTGLATSTGPDGTSTGSSSFSSDDAPFMQTAIYAASFATCVMLDEPTPNPAACIALTQPDGMTVDLQAGSGMPGASAGMVSIPIGSDFVGADIIEVRLRLRTLSDPSADSNQTGEVWLVDAFTEDSLQSTLPQTVQAMPLAADMGPSLPDTDNVWVLPDDVLVPDADLHLGIYGVTTDGVDYVTHVGDPAPVLEVDYLR